MDMNDLVHIFGIFLLSTVKLGFGGVPAAIFSKYPFFKAVTITSAGGIFGCLVFSEISTWLLDWWNKFRLKYLPYRKPRPEGVVHHKLAYKIMQKWGLAGLAFFTPLILSIPIGTLLAVHFYHDKHKVLSFLFISILLWDIVLCYLYNTFYHFIILHFPAI
jgi:hypothetical protein